MKKLLLILSFGLLISACDKELVEDYVVDNLYNKAIKIKYKNKIDGIIYDTTINANARNVIICTYTDFGTKVSENQVSNLFDYFILSSDTLVSKANLLSNYTWRYSQESKTYAKYYLKVDSTFFK
jgi:hypothetical protein